MTFEAAIAGVGSGDRGDTFRFRTPVAPVLARHDHHRDPGAISPSVASERLSSVTGQRGGFIRPPAAKSFLFGSTNRSAGDPRKPPGGSERSPMRLAQQARLREPDADHRDARHPPGRRHRRPIIEEQHLRATSEAPGGAPGGTAARGLPVFRGGTTGDGDGQPPRLEKRPRGTDIH